MFPFPVTAQFSGTFMRTNAMFCPSGDQQGYQSLNGNGASVSCLGVPPSMESVQIYVAGIGAPALCPAKTMVLPSGEIWFPVPYPCNLILGSEWRGTVVTSPPSAETYAMACDRQLPLVASVLFVWYTRFPSGDHRGCPGPPACVTNVAFPPCTGWV